MQRSRGPLHASALLSRATDRSGGLCPGKMAKPFRCFSVDARRTMSQLAPGELRQRPIVSHWSRLPLPPGRSGVRCPS
jgi:hypothetical protein